MKKLRAAVVGVGYLGKFHAQKYASLKDQVELVGVCDLSKDQSEKVAKDNSTQAFQNPLDLIGKIDVATIATPTTRHFEVAKAYLEAGIHLLVEKPLAENSTQASALCQLAKEKNLVLQVGHIERFNPSFIALKKELSTPPQFVELNRLAPFKVRALDVDVATDLMVHDIDLMLDLIPEEIVKLDAFGFKVMTKTWDVVQATFEFASGRRGHIHVNRCYPHAVRSVAAYSSNTNWYADLGAGQLSRVFVTSGSSAQASETEVKAVDKHDAMLEETKCFLSAVRRERSVAVSGEDGLRTIRVLEQVLAKLG